jgi:hypothetical protein
MVSTHENPDGRSAARSRAPLALAAAAALLVAGCGGGGGGASTDKEGAGKTSTTEDGEKVRTAPRGTKPGPPPATGSVIRSFNVTVASKTQARVTMTLTKPTEVLLVVRKVVGSGEQKVGRVPFGEKPKGDVTINWNVRVNGKQLAPGRYRVQMRGRGAGKSVPQVITVPG